MDMQVEEGLRDAAVTVEPTGRNLDACRTFPPPLVVAAKPLERTLP